MASSDSTEATHGCPDWRLDDVDGKWRLSVLLPDGVDMLGSEGGVEINEAEIRLAHAGSQRAQWCIQVPQRARPIGPNATCKVKRKDGYRLIIEWSSSLANDTSEQACQSTPLSQKSPQAILSGMHDLRRLGSEQASVDGVTCEQEDEEQLESRAEALCLEHAVVESSPQSHLESEKAEKDTSCKGVPVAQCKAEKEEDGQSAEAEGSDASPKCFMCGKKARSQCSKCHVAWYCDSPCQRAHWSGDHRIRCEMMKRLVGAENQRRRGDVELAVQTLEELLKDTGKAVVKEAEKEMTFEQGLANALLRNFAAVMSALATALSSDEVADYKFCRASCNAVAVFLDMAAVLGETRRPLEMQVHVEDITAGLSENLGKEADPVLSAWMVYDKYAKAVENKMSSMSKKIPQLKAATLVALRDVLAAAHDLLVASGSYADKRGATRIDTLLSGGEKGKRLQVGLDVLHLLKPHLPVSKAYGDDVPEDDDEDDK